MMYYLNILFIFVSLFILHFHFGTGIHSRMLFLQLSLCGSLCCQQWILSIFVYWWAFVNACVWGCTLLIRNKKWKIFLLFWFSILHHSYLNLWKARALQVSPVHIHQVLFVQHPSKESKTVCVSTHLRNTSHDITFREMNVSSLLFYQPWLFGVCETVVSKRIFGDKRARENSSLNHYDVNPKTLKCHANVGYFIIYIFLIWPTLFQQNTFAIYSERMALGLFYHI